MTERVLSRASGGKARDGSGVAWLNWGSRDRIPRRNILENRVRQIPTRERLGTNYGQLISTNDNSHLTLAKLVRVS